MSSKMLIDASHPEETRVAVMKGNRVDEFDFESDNKKQLRGNIYLAKVTRVEPSLQAAFIDYGGNRHGFLAFSEIHPDYYQIPVADRQALLKEEAEAVREEDEEPAPKKAKRSRRAADAEDEADEVQAKSRRRSRRRRSKRDEAEADETQADAGEADDNQEAVETDEGTARTIAAANEGESVSEPADDPDEAADEKPKRRRTSRPRTKKAAEKEESEAAAGSQVAEAVATDEEEAKPKRRRRAKKAEDAPGEANIEAVDVAAPPRDTEAQPEEKPKRRRRSKKAEPQADAERDAEADADGDPGAQASEPDVASEASSPPEVGEEEKPKRTRRTRSRKAKPEPPEEEASEPVEPGDEVNGDDSAPDDVEDVGTDDALEEVPTRRVSRRNYKIQEVIKRRQIMLVQVVKEERGNKGAALTTYLSLAGRYSVLMPNTARGGGISRKITNAGDRKKLKEIASSLDVTPGMGVILRTAGAARTEQEITRDFEYLLRLWENVRTLTLKSTAPCLVYEEGSLIKRSIRDLYSKNTNEIVVAGREGYEEARDFMEMLEPGQAKNVKYYDGTTPLFAKMGVEAQLDHMLQPQVTLKSGGYLIINQTEALVAIDVNSGKSTRQHSIEETATQTNLEAADEVARQLRLRDLAGLIVIDFIDMDDRRNNRAVEKRLKEALKSDRARIQVGRISHFGLLEMSRQRMRASVLESATETCPTCAGLGYVRSPSSVSIHVLRAIEEHLIRSAKNNVTVKTRLNTALYLLNNKRTSIDDLEARFGVTITIEADESVGQNHLVIERGDVAQPRTRSEQHVQVDSIQPDEADDTGSEDVPLETAAAADDETAAETEDEQPRKRRRGRRGGKRASEKEAPDDALEAVESQAEDETGTAPEAHAEEAEAEAKPKRRRRRKKDAETEPSADVSAVETDDTAPVSTGDVVSEEAADDEPPRPERRSTSRPRRKSADEAVAETAVHATSDAVVATEPEAEPAELIGEAANGASRDETDANDEPPRPARRRTSRRSRKNGASDEAATPTASTAGDDSGEESGEKKNWLQRTFFS